MSDQVFDVVTIRKDGSQLKLGRTWLRNKEGKVSMSFDLNCLPLVGATAQLVSTDSWNPAEWPSEFRLMLPVDKGADKPTFWLEIGSVKAAAAKQAEAAFEVIFDSLPFAGNLVAFPPRPPQAAAAAASNDIPFG